MRRVIPLLLMVGLVGCGDPAKKPKAKPARKAAAGTGAPKQPARGLSPKAADEVRINAVELAGAHDSLDAVGKAVVAGLVAEDRKALEKELVTKAEFYALFGALTNDPQGRGASVQIAWMNQSANSRGALAKLLVEWGGKEIVFVRLEAEETQNRVGLIEHRNPKLVVKNAAGEEQTITGLGPVLEHKASGKFKLLLFSDRG